MKAINPILLSLFAAILSGCVHTVKTPFDESEFLPYRGDGTAVVAGQAFLKTRGGDVKYAAGEPIELIPSTSYTREIWEASLQGLPSKADPRYYKEIRTTIADAEGRFEFSKLPAGTYFLETTIEWLIPGSYIPTGGVVKKEIVLKDGETLKVMLTY